MEEKKTESRHKGSFVGGYFSDEQLEKIAAIEEAFDSLGLGDPGRNRSRALRWLVDSFHPDWIKDFPKSPAPAGRKARTGMVTA